MPISTLRASPNNPILADVIKFYIAIDSDTCIDGFYSQEYIMEKLEGIMKGTSTWHACIEMAYQEALEEL